MDRKIIQFPVKAVLPVNPFLARSNFGGEVEGHELITRVPRAQPLQPKHVY